MSFIEINFNNSFNKEGNPAQNKEVVSENSTSSGGNNFFNHGTEVNSINTASLTNSVVNGQLNIIKTGNRKTIIREIFIAAAGTIVGSIITYLILGIK